MNWLPIEQCRKQPGTTYLISGWCGNTPDTERWYVLAQFTEGEGWWDIEASEFVYPPTHFTYFDPIFE